eukprot:COSAG06_NODE_37726_length_431_cov_10.813253_1_plen_88_part_01
MGADARRLFKEAQSPKCAACGKPGHTAGTCSKPLPAAKVKKSAAEAVLRSAGEPTETGDVHFWLSRCGIVIDPSPCTIDLPRGDNVYI